MSNPVSQPNAQAVQAADGHRFEVLSFPNAAPEAPAILIMPAMGVEAGYYGKLAGQLSQRGFHVLVSDLRGHGSSNIPLGRKHDFGYRELIECDWPATVSLANRLHPQSKKILLGHSMGGEISSLFVASQPDAVDGLVLIASGTSHGSGWPFPGNVIVPTLSVLMWGVGLAVGYYPGEKLGLMGNDAATIMRDAARNAVLGDYKVAGSGVRYDPMMEKTKLPLLAISFSDDVYNPPGSLDNLCGKMPNAYLTRVRWEPTDLGLEKVGHFKWVRNGEKVAERIAGWIGESIANGSER